MVIIDWGQAVKVGGVGFGWVFMVLVVLAVAIWLSGVIIRKLEKSKEKPADAETNSGEGV